MKEIIIFQHGISPLQILDNDDSDISEYTTKISALLEASNVLILETTSGNTILRPHKISSIQITEMAEMAELSNVEQLQKTENQLDNKSEKQQTEASDVVEEDFITDGA